MDESTGVSATVEPMVPLLAYQKADVESDARFSWCCWSRQIGKSFTKSLRRLLRGILRRQNQIFLSAGLRQSRELMMKVRQHCQVLNIASAESGRPLLEGMTAGSLSLELPNGVRIIALPANPHTARGYTGDVFLDEFAMHRDDREIWAAVFPSVLRGGGELDVASTPKGRDNLFALLRDNPQFAHSVVTLPEAVAAGLKVDPDEIRRSMHDEELYRQEFLCEFLDEASALLTYEQIGRVEDPWLDKQFDLGRLGGLKGPLYVGVDGGGDREGGRDAGPAGIGDTRRAGDGGGAVPRAVGGDSRAALAPAGAAVLHRCGWDGAAAGGGRGGGLWNIAGGGGHVHGRGEGRDGHAAAAQGGGRLHPDPRR
jgi:hypothetical protein